MKLKFLLSLLLGVALTGLFAQPAIDSTHMPAPYDTISRTVVTNLSAINYTNSDSNYFWDYSALEGSNASGDTFVTVLSTEIAYIAIFNNPFDKEHKATVVDNQASGPSLPGLTISNVFNFYKAAYSYYGQVGFGAEINGITMPVKYDHADKIYNYPFVFGQSDTSLSQYGIDIPNLGYNAQRKQRINLVDGWGTLVLPGDTFNVYRIKSVVETFDSIYIDSIGYGFGFNSTVTEYKWISDECKLPVFQVSKRQGMGGNAQAWFLDHRDFSGIREVAASPQFVITPNPANDQLSIAYPTEGFTRWEIMDMTGRRVLQGALSPERTVHVADLHPGLYLLRIIGEQETQTGKFLKN